MKFQNKIFNKNDITQIDAEFLTYLKNKNEELFLVFQKHRKKNEELTPNLILEVGKILDCFLSNFFDITKQYNTFNESLPIVKRNFVQRRVYLQYKNLEIFDVWESYYNFENEEKFIEDVLTTSEEMLEKIEKFTAFVLFSKIGKEKFGNYEVFCLPKAIEERRNSFLHDANLVASKEKTERTGFSLTDKAPSKKTIDWNLYYCLYCHNRGKDSCSKGLNSEKQGCPLKQDISESIFVKKEGFAIGAMAIIMRQNPFFILTGRRICNDCELSCIFQKQEPVDIQSVESAILNDVLNLNYGFEMYYLLLLWNPLNIQKLPEITNKTIGIAGAGPAGMFASYLFAKAGGNVCVFDALNIEIPKKIQFLAENVITTIDEFLNEKLENRTPSNIGGVMEYGITARWNKNYLDLAIATLLRFGVKFVGSVRIGGLLNYNDIFTRFKFNHFALCVGSATPQLPLKLTNIFSGYRLANGVMMASDFLMSLHINTKSDDLTKFTQKNVYILGCGLTAIDTACEIRALLLQNGVKNPSIKIIYHRDFESSSAYKTNFLELKKALEEGIEILQNTKIVKIHKNHLGIIAIENDDGEILPCQLLLIAIGTKPNIAHIHEFIGKNSVSFFGDCNPQYTGSVVKALASVKNNIANSLLETSQNNNQFNEETEHFLQKKVTNIKNIHDNLWEIEISSPILSEKASAGNVLKLQIMGKNSIALTVTHKCEGKIYGYLFNTNAETQSIIDGFFAQKTIHINGINCTHFPKIEKNSVIIASIKTKYVFERIYKENKIILYEHFEEIEQKLHYIVAIENEKALLQIEKKLENAPHFVVNFQKMNCMLGGICGRCVKESGDYGCF